MSADFGVIKETFLEAPIGLLELRTKNDHLIGVKFSAQQGLASTAVDSPVLQNTISQLQRYFSSAQHSLSLPVLMEGTPFQKVVWEALQRIPIGETRTYGALAKILNTSPRAIGRACRENPLLIIVPCHRVVGEKGLGGFFGKKTGHFMEVKEWLLLHEGAFRDPSTIR